MKMDVLCVAALGQNASHPKSHPFEALLLGPLAAGGWVLPA